MGMRGKRKARHICRLLRNSVDRPKINEKMPSRKRGHFFMGFVQGEGRTQATLFPVTLEELIPDDHVCRVIDTFVDRLDMAGFGFLRAAAAGAGRPGYSPPAPFKLYLYRYFQHMPSSPPLVLLLPPTLTTL